MTKFNSYRNLMKDPKKTYADKLLQANTLFTNGEVDLSEYNILVSEISENKAAGPADANGCAEVQ